VSNVAGGVVGMVTGLAEQTLTHAVLQLSKAMNSMASSLRAVKSTQFVYTPSNASSLRDPNFKLELIKVSSSSNSAHEPKM